jgi:hypothetical protein
LLLRHPRTGSKDGTRQATAAAKVPTAAAGTGAAGARLLLLLLLLVAVLRPLLPENGGGRRRHNGKSIPTTQGNGAPSAVFVCRRRLVSPDARRLCSLVSLFQARGAARTLFGKAWLVKGSAEPRKRTKEATATKVRRRREAREEEKAAVEWESSVVMSPATSRISEPEAVTPPLPDRFECSSRRSRGGGGRRWPMEQTPLCRENEKGNDAIDGQISGSGQTAQPLRTGRGKRQEKKTPKGRMTADKETTTTWSAGDGVVGSSSATAGCETRGRMLGGGTAAPWVRVRGGPYYYSVVVVVRRRPSSIGLVGVYSRRSCTGHAQQQQATLHQTSCMLRGTRPGCSDVVDLACGDGGGGGGGGGGTC